MTPVNEQLQLVAFRVGDGHYALDIMRVKEILQPVTITPIPKAPGFIEGVIELRGAILPVVDLRKRFDLPTPTPSRSEKLMISTIEIGGVRMLVALVVDAVMEPIRVGAEHMRPAPALAQGEGSYFRAVVHYRRGRSATRVDGGASRRQERRRLGSKGPALESEPTRRSEDVILMVLDLDALLSSSEKVSLQHLAGASVAPAPDRRQENP